MMKAYISMSTGVTGVWFFARLAVRPKGKHGPLIDGTTRRTAEEAKASAGALGYDVTNVYGGEK